MPFNGTARTNALTFDLEHWHSATLLKSSIDDSVDYIEDSVNIVLDILQKHDVNATFFVVGEVAEKYPKLIEQIRNEGHEIGSHGHTHTPLFELTPEEFETELEWASAAIEQATGVRPDGFRAPNFSITRETEWAFDILESKGYRYDSSVFPMKTPMYGVSDAPIRPYTVGPPDRFRSSSNEADSASLVEWPISAIDSVVRLPMGGGFYGRVLPERVLRWGINRLNQQGIPANLYFHPWEFNPKVQTDSVEWHKRFISFYGIDRLQNNLNNLLSAYSFNTARNVLKQETLLEVDDRHNVQSASSVDDLK